MTSPLLVSPYLDAANEPGDNVVESSENQAADKAEDENSGGTHTARGSGFVGSLLQRASAMRQVPENPGIRRRK